MIKILLVTQANHTGLTYHRQLVPHLNLERNYDYEVIPCINIYEVSDEKLKEYQIVSFLRLVNEQERSIEIIERCKKAGCKVIIDIDDYWFLHNKHPLLEVYNKHNIANQTIDGLRNADYITTTTEFFAEKIKNINKNVIVLPNAIDPEEKQFNPEPKESNKVRFGWIGGIYHEADLRLLYEGIMDVYKTVINNKFQFCLGGFQANDSYKFMELIITNNYKHLKNKQYIEYLKKFVPLSKDFEAMQPYKRLWGQSVFHYAKLYNDIDVSLIPLEQNSFNQYKSQLKIIEAGFFKKACIVSNVMPYTIDCTKENSLLINPSKRNDGWGIGIKSLIHNPNKIKDLGEAMYDTVKDKYNVNTVNVLRDQLYKKICE